MFHSDPRIDVLMYLVAQEVIEGKVVLPAQIVDEIDKQMLCLGITRHQAESFVVDEMLDSHLEHARC